MDRLPNRFLEIVRTVVLSLYGLALVSVFVVDSVDMVLHPRATLVQFLVIISTVGGMALWTVMVGREAPTTDEKPFRVRHVGGIEVHIYSDGTRVTFEGAQLIFVEFPDPGHDEADDSGEDDGGDGPADRTPTPGGGSSKLAAFR